VGVTESRSRSILLQKQIKIDESNTEEQNIRITDSESLQCAESREGAPPAPRHSPRVRVCMSERSVSLRLSVTRQKLLPLSVYIQQASSTRDVRWSHTQGSDPPTVTVTRSEDTHDSSLETPTDEPFRDRMTARHTARHTGHSETHSHRDGSRTRTATRTDEKEDPSFHTKKVLSGPSL
jgi:hypothetical protein